MQGERLKKFEQPTSTFPYKIKTRLCLLSVPRKCFAEEPVMPSLTPFGVRQGALKGPINYRAHEAALPYLRRLLNLKRTYKNMFNEERMQRLNRIIEASNATIYSKLANCVINLKAQQQDPRGSADSSRKTKKAWTESDWRKHTDYALGLARPKRVFEPEPLERGESVPLDHLLPRIQNLVQIPESKVYRRLSQDDWYRDPIKVPSGALKYQITERVKKLAEPRKYEVE